MARPGFSPLPVLVGSGVDLGVSYALQLGLFSLLVATGEIAIERFADSATAQQTLVDQLATPSFALLTMGIGAFGTLVGGITAGSMARARPVLHGAGVGAISLAIGLVGRFTPAPGLADPYGLLALLLALPAGALGGALVGARG